MASGDRGVRAVPLVYFIYGLRVDAGTPLPGLLRASGPNPADVSVRLNEWPDALTCATDATRFYTSDDHTPSGDPVLVIDAIADSALYRMRYADGVEFGVDRPGTTVWGRWPTSSTHADALTYLLNPVLGVVLRLRGVTALHGSSVVIGDGAVVILGPSGAGKSTTAAALAARGCAVLADDIVALRPADDAAMDSATPFAYPAYTHFRLWPEAADFLLGPDTRLAPLTPTWDKRQLDVEQSGYRMQSAPAPLRAVYVLAPREDAPNAPRVEPMDPTTALLTLVAHVYGARIPVDAARAHDLALLGAIVRTVPVRRAVPHTDPARLGALCDRIEADVRAG